MDTISKDAEKVIASLYKKYLERREAGMGKADAKVFGSSQSTLELLALTMPLDDLDETLRELGRAKWVQNLYADNTVIRTVLSDAVIVHMENRFKHGLRDVLEFLSKFIP